MGGERWEEVLLFHVQPLNTFKKMKSIGSASYFDVLSTSHHKWPVGQAGPKPKSETNDSAVKNFYQKDLAPTFANGEVGEPALTPTILSEQVVGSG